MMKLSSLAIVFFTTFFLVGCNEDDDDGMITPVEPEIELPNFIAYNTGMTPVLPEGIEFDTEREAFIISSAAGAGISFVSLSGAVSPFISPATFAGNGIFGLQVDKANDRLLAVSSNLQNPAVANLFIFKLSDGSLIHNVDLSTLSPGLNFVNDVAVDASGNAYVSNSDQGIIFKVDLDGNASIFFQENSFTPADPTMETGFNGIEYHENGYLIISHHATSKIYKLDIASQAILEVSLPTGNILGGDGIFLDGNELAVVSNIGVGFVSKFESGNEWSSATLSGNTFATGDIFPTAVVKVGDHYMVSNSYFNYPAYGNTPTNFLIQKASFDFSQRFSGSSSEIPRVNTPIVPFGYGDTYPSHFYEGCDTPISDGVVDLQGDWFEVNVTIGGNEIAAQGAPHSERIEQCGNRLLVVSNHVLHEVFVADDTMTNGVNDINGQQQPTHASGRFEGNSLILTPIFPPQAGINLPDVTRELIQDDSGDDVLRFFNPLLQTVKYLKKS